MTLLNQNTYRSGFAWTVFLNIIARGINFFLGILLARNFLPESTDVYLYVWNGINVVLAFSSTINLLVVSPAYITFSQNGQQSEATKLNNAFLNIYTIPFLGAGVIIFFFPLFVFNIGTGFVESQLLESEHLLRFSGLWLTLVLVNNFLGNILLSNKFFIASLVGQVLAGVITLVFIYAFKSMAGISAFLIGQFIGIITSLVFYFWILSSKLKFRPQLFFFKLPRTVMKDTASVISVSFPTMVANFLIIYFLSNMAYGYVSAFNYGSNLSNLPDVILLSQLVSIVGVKFSELSANNNKPLLFDTYSMLCKHMFFLMSGIAIVVIIASSFFIDIFYGKQNIGENLFHLTSIALGILVVALPFKSLDILNNRLLASLQVLSGMLRFNLPVKIINIFLLFLMARQFGYMGILIYSVLMPLIFVMMHFYLLRRWFSSKQLNRHIRQLFFLFIVSLFIYFGCHLLDRYFFAELNGFLRLFIITGVVTAMCYITERLFQLTSFASMFKRKMFNAIYFLKRHRNPMTR